MDPGVDAAPGMGRKTHPHRMIADFLELRKPGMGWKPHPRRMIAGFLGLTEPARGRNCPSDQPRDRFGPGEDKVSSTDENPSPPPD